MNSVFSKNKEKRRRTSSSEGNMSFVQNVTSRVSGLLPSTFTKWFSSPSSSNTNGSAPTADITDSSTEDEALDSPVVTQPPGKRMRYSTPPGYDHFTPADANCPVSNTKPIESTYSSYNATPFPTRGTLKTPATSPTEDVKEQTDRETTKYKSEPTISNVGQSVASKRKSIFDTYGTEESKRACLKTSRNVIRDPKAPCFKPSLLGSPFYPGRTMYGGASSSYVNQPNIKQKKVAVVNQSHGSDDSAISTSARRIMDLLEQYSSPLNEAKRIPHYTRPKHTNSINNSTEQSSPYSNRIMSYKTQELHVPNIASILRLKQKSRLMDTTSAARQIIASHSSALDFQPYPVATLRPEPETKQTHKMTTKVKARVTRANRGNQNDFEVGTPIKIQTAALNLDQDKLPKFSFGTPAAQLQATATSTPKNTFDSTLNKKNTELSNTKEAVVSNNFKFSNPLRVSWDGAETDTTIPEYKFYSPERRVEEKLDQYKDSVCLDRTAKGTEKPIDQSNNWKCSECWVSNKADATKCVCCGAKQASKSTEKGAKCTVCKLADSQPFKSKCSNCEKIQINNVASPIVPKASDASKWKCNDCWVSNDSSAEKCACCGAAKAMKPAAAPPKRANAAPAPEGASVDWKCEDCWISNKSSVVKCAACGAAKPGAKPPAATTPAPPAASSPFFKTSSDSFKNIVQTQKNEKWECTSCMVRNEVNVSACVCCGAERESKNKMPGNKFNFGLNTSFKFGINPNLQEATLAKKPALETPPIELKEQEKNNNVLAETPTFTLTLPVKKVEDKFEPPKAKLDDAPKPSFSFGIPKQSAPTPGPTALHLSPAKGLQEEKEKPQEVPQMKLSAPDQSKLSGGMFSSPLTLPSSCSALAVSPATVLSPSSADTKKDVTSISITLKPAATSTAKPQQQATFAFGASSLKPAMFGTPTTTAAESTPIHAHSRNLFTPPAQTTVAATTAPTMSFKPTETTASSLFQKPNPATTSSVSFFQSGATSTTTAPQSVASTAPSFTFGSNTAAAAPAAEKSAFFSFGNNATKTDAPSMFKTPFGGAAETNANVNSFGLSSGNPLGTGNVLGASSAPASSNAMASGTLTSGSGVTPSNPLGGSNSLTTNPLGSGTVLQSGNALSSGTSNLFGSAVQKENVWSSNTPSTNLFASNTTTNSMQKPAGFTFGSSGTFNVGSTTPAFGASTQPAQNNIFGMASQNNNQPSMFSSPAQSQPASLFGAPQPAAANPAPPMGMFGSPSTGATPTFGGQSQSIPSFDVPLMTSTPAPTPAFNFGAQQSTGMFGFGQQQQPQQAGVYNFGGAPAGNPQVQFNMGSSASTAGSVNTAGRRMRKAVRRNPPR